MGKSLKNGVGPDEIHQSYGLRADRTVALRQWQWLEMRMADESGEPFERCIQYPLREHA